MFVSSFVFINILRFPDVSGNGYYFQSSYVANVKIVCFCFCLSKEFQINKEQRIVQPTSTVVPHTVNPDLPRAPLELTHQAKSYPGRTTTKFTRTPSISSQGSLDSCISKQVKEKKGKEKNFPFFLFDL